MRYLIACLILVGCSEPVAPEPDPPGPIPKECAIPPIPKDLDRAMFFSDPCWPDK